MYSYSLSLTSALDGGGWSTPRPCRFTPGKDPVPTVQEARWAPWRGWTGGENLVPTGIRSRWGRVAIPTELTRPTGTRPLIKYKRKVLRSNHDIRKLYKEVRQILRILNRVTEVWREASMTPHGECTLPVTWKPGRTLELVWT